MMGVSICKSYCSGEQIEVPLGWTKEDFVYFAACVMLLRLLFLMNIPLLKVGDSGNQLLVIGWL